MVKTTRTSGTNVHARALADRFKAPRGTWMSGAIVMAGFFCATCYSFSGSLTGYRVMMRKTSRRTRSQQSLRCPMERFWRRILFSAASYRLKTGINCCFRQDLLKRRLRRLSMPSPTQARLWLFSLFFYARFPLQIGNHRLQQGLPKTLVGNERTLRSNSAPPLGKRNPNSRSRDRSPPNWSRNG